MRLDFLFRGGGENAFYELVVSGVVAVFGNSEHKIATPQGLRRTDELQGGKQEQGRLLDAG